MIDPTTQFINIPMPRQTQNVYRGFHHTHAPETTPISTRWTDKDRKYIEKQARKLNITFSEFVRWCSFYGAREIDRIDKETSFREAAAAEKRSRVNLSEYSDDTQ